MLYPIKFIPHLKERLWGGTELLSRVKQGKGAKIDPTKPYGESWDLSSVAGDESVVANGYLKRNTIEEIVEVYMGNLVGEKNYDRYVLTFPMLIKSLECCYTLSLQVQPDDELAAERHDSYGKTEMWYIAGCREGAAIYIGFKDANLSREQYLEAVNEDRLPEIMNRVEVKKGDVFFIPAGTIHALGSGVDVIEIQQTSDITYRIYDWNRVDDKGQPRELHTALAVDAIDFGSDADACYKRYTTKENQAVGIVDCPYFTTNAIALNGKKEFDYSSLDSFVLYICAEGEADVVMGEHTEHITPYELVLIPAEADVVELRGQATLLEVYIK